MIEAPRHPEEPARLAALEDTGLFFSPAEERFDRITRLASHILGAPIALVTLVGDTRQWLKSAQGLDATEIPREVSFCAHAISAGRELVIEDAREDDRFHDNPFVTGAPHVRAYAGKVIHAVSGEPLGTLCVLDSKPRAFSDEELARLDDLAAIAQDEVAREAGDLQSEYMRNLPSSERRERIDLESRLLNHDAMAELLMTQAERSGRGGQPLSVALVRIAGLKERMGAEPAAAAMRGAAATLLRTLDRGEALGRYDPETFIAILSADAERAIERAQVLREALLARPLQAGRLSVRPLVQCAAATWTSGQSLAALLEDAAESLSG